VMKLDRAEAMAFYRAHYTPSNAIVIIAGDVSEEEVRPLAEKFYGALSNTTTFSPPAQRLRTEEPQPIAARRVILNDPRAGIDLLQRGYLVPSYSKAQGNEAAAFDVLADILGGGLSSRLSKALVIDGKIAQEAGAFYSGDEMDYGKLVVYAAASAGSRMAHVEAAVDRVIAEVAAKGVTAAELELAKKRLRAQIVYAADSQSRLARLFGTALATGSSIDDVLGYPDRLTAVTADEVKAVAQKYLVIERSVTGIMRPRPAAE
jgi:zinc protease